MDNLDLIQSLTNLISGGRDNSDSMKFLLNLAANTKNTELLSALTVEIMKNRKLVEEISRLLQSSTFVEILAENAGMIKILTGLVSGENDVDLVKTLMNLAPLGKNAELFPILLKGVLNNEQVIGAMKIVEKGVKGGGKTGKTEL